MAGNQIYDKPYMSVAVTNPVAVTSGQPCRFGSLTGIALTDKGKGGNASGDTSVDFGWGVWSLAVHDTVGGGIAAGDALFYADGAPGEINNTATNYFFGFALAAVGAGATTTINVVHVPSPGAGTLADGAVSSAKLAGGAVGATQLAANAVTTAKILNANVTQAKLEAGAAGAGLTGLVVKFSGDKDVIGAIPVLHRIDIAAGALADTDVILTHKTRVIDAWLVLRGAGVASTTLTVKNGATAISDAMAASGAAKALVRAASLDPAQWEIAAGGTLRVTSASGATQPDATVFVLGLRVA